VRIRTSRATVSAAVVWVSRLLLALGVALVSYLSVIEVPRQPSLPFIDKIEHAAAFFSLGACAYFAFQDSVRAATLGLLLYGLGIECVQWWLPWREFSLLDWVADGLGVLLWLGCVRVWFILVSRPQAAQRRS